METEDTTLQAAGVEPGSRLAAIVGGRADTTDGRKFIVAVGVNLTCKSSQVESCSDHHSTRRLPVTRLWQATFDSWPIGRSLPSGLSLRLNLRVEDMAGHPACQVGLSNSKSV